MAGRTRSADFRKNKRPAGFREAAGQKLRFLPLRENGTAIAPSASKRKGRAQDEKNILRSARKKAKKRTRQQRGPLRERLAPCRAPGRRLREVRPGSAWCLRAESNHRHGDFQSPALPTELQRRVFFKQLLHYSTPLRKNQGGERGFFAEKGGRERAQSAKSTARVSAASSPLT